MTVTLNHTIVNCLDRDQTAAFYADVLGLEKPTGFGPFLVLELANDVSLDFVSAESVHPQHYAFLVSEEEFDAILGRIQQRGLTYWADPFHREEAKTNSNDGGRGVYWEDPNGHNLEIITRPYGSGG